MTMTKELCIWIMSQITTTIQTLVHGLRPRPKLDLGSRHCMGH